VTDLLDTAEALGAGEEPLPAAPPYVVRPAGPGDLAFVRSGWVESLMMRVRSRIESEVKRLVRTSTVRVACDQKDPDTLLGFAVVDAENPALLHYVYVRKDLRREGIGTALARPDEVREYSFATDDLERCFRPTERCWTHSPRIRL
jgi:GNAT superfamily N-acetyltransferase